MLVVSGGSHAGNTNGFLRIDRVTPGRRVHLVPLEPIAADEGDAYRFASAHRGASASGATRRRAAPTESASPDVVPL